MTKMYQCIGHSQTVYCIIYGQSTCFEWSLLYLSLTCKSCLLSIDLCGGRLNASFTHTDSLFRLTSFAETKSVIRIFLLFQCMFSFSPHTRSTTQRRNHLCQHNQPFIQTGFQFTLLKPVYPFLSHTHTQPVERCYQCTCLEVNHYLKVADGPSSDKTTSTDASCLLGSAL